MVYEYRTQLHYRVSIYKEVVRLYELHVMYIV